MWSLVLLLQRMLLVLSLLLISFMAVNTDAFTTGQKQCGGRKLHLQRPQGFNYAGDGATGKNNEDDVDSSSFSNEKDRRNPTNTNNAPTSIWSSLSSSLPNPHIGTAAPTQRNAASISAPACTHTTSQSPTPTPGPGPSYLESRMDGTRPSSGFPSITDFMGNSNHGSYSSDEGSGLGRQNVANNSLSTSGQRSAYSANSQAHLSESQSTQQQQQQPPLSDSYRNNIVKPGSRKTGSPIPQRKSSSVPLKIDPWSGFPISNLQKSPPTTKEAIAGTHSDLHPSFSTKSEFQTTSAPSAARPIPVTTMESATMTQSEVEAPDDWRRELDFLRAQVGQLGSDLSFFSNQIAQKNDASNDSNMGGSAISWTKQMQDYIQGQIERIQAGQMSALLKLEASIQELRHSLSLQALAMKTIQEQALEQGQQIANLGQTLQDVVGDNGNNLDNPRDNSVNSKAISSRLDQLEERLLQQQQYIQQTASYSTTSPSLATTRDPDLDKRLEDLERLVQQQAKWIEEILTSRNSRDDSQLMSTLKAQLLGVEIQIKKLQEEVSIQSQTTISDARLAALEDNFRKFKGQQNLEFEGFDSSRMDPRLVALEEKVKHQEKQLNETIAAISDARITALRAKLIEQKDRVQQQVHLQERESAGGVDKPMDDTFPKYDSSSTRNNEENTSSSPFSFQEDMTLPNGKSSLTNGAQKVNLASSYPPSRFSESSFSNDRSPYQKSLSSTFDGYPDIRNSDPVEDSLTEKYTGQKNGQNKDVLQARPSSSFGPSPDQSFERGGRKNNKRTSSFRGNAFARTGDITIETFDDQKPVDIGVPRKTLGEASRGNESRGAGIPWRYPSSPIPEANVGAKSVRELDPAIARQKPQKHHFGGGITSDQSTWDTSRPNPDAANQWPQPSKSASRQDASRKRGGESHVSTRHHYYRTQSRQPGHRGGVQSDQLSLDSSRRIPRDIDDIQGRNWERKARQVHPSDRFDNGRTNMSASTDKLRDYLEWCELYGKVPREDHVEEFERQQEDSNDTNRFYDRNTEDVDGPYYDDMNQWYR